MSLRNLPILVADQHAASRAAVLRELRALAYANPLGTVIEMARAVVLDGVFPPILACCGFLVVSLAVCRGGYAVFERYKGILVDVI